MTDPANISLWLALIAVASLVQSTILVGVAIMAWRASRQAQNAIKRFERQQFEPLMGRVHGAVDDVRQAVTRARAIEVEVRQAVAATTQSVAGRLWPVIATGRAVQAAMSTLRRPARPSSLSATLETTRR